VSNSGLPPTLRAFGAARRGLGPLDAPEGRLRVAFPPAGARIDLGGDPTVALKALGGVPPFLWFVDGVPIGDADLRRAASVCVGRLCKGRRSRRCAAVHVLPAPGGASTITLAPAGASITAACAPGAELSEGLSEGVNAACRGMSKEPVPPASRAARGPRVARP
jgi:hypothetical protein